jgi:GNAT superfamily N-acetyltransferase
VGLTIRPATADDVAGIGSVADETWRATYASILPEEAIGQFLVDAYRPAAIGARIDRADRFDVAIDDAASTVVGFSEWVATPDPGEALWAATYVRPDWQRRGIGRTFLLGAVGGYRDARQRLLVVVAEANTAGTAFYRAMGFIPVERVSSGILGTPVAELRMSMLLR